VVSDENAIRNCIAKYFHHLDDRNFDEWKKLLTDDAKVSVNGKAKWPPDLQYLDQRGQHIFANTVVDIDGDEATVFSDYFYVGEIGPKHFERIEILDFGRYTDRLVKRDGTWLISVVDMQVIYADRADRPD
jgi:hypothetical protein